MYLKKAKKGNIPSLLYLATCSISLHWLFYCAISSVALKAFITFKKTNYTICMAFSRSSVTFSFSRGITLICSSHPFVCDLHQWFVSKEMRQRDLRKQWSWLHEMLLRWILSNDAPVGKNKNLLHTCFCVFFIVHSSWTQKDKYYSPLGTFWSNNNILNVYQCSFKSKLKKINVQVHETIVNAENF